MDYNDLSNKTIYDFTDDPKIIEKITGNVSKVSYIETCHIINKMADIVDFAYIMQDDELYKLATKALKKAQKDCDSIVADGLKDGIIID
jgi:hypothetical protein